MKTLIIELLTVLFSGLSAIFLARAAAQPTSRSGRWLRWTLPLIVVCATLCLWAYTGKDILQTATCIILRDAPQCRAAVSFHTDAACQRVISAADETNVICSAYISEVDVDVNQLKHRSVSQLTRRAFEQCINQSNRLYSAIKNESYNVPVGARDALNELLQSHRRLGQVLVFTPHYTDVPRSAVRPSMEFVQRVFDLRNTCRTPD